MGLNADGCFRSEWHSSAPGEARQGDEPEIYGIMRGAKGSYPQEETSMDSEHHVVCRRLRNGCMGGENSTLEASYGRVQGLCKVEGIDYHFTNPKPFWW